MTLFTNKHHIYEAEKLVPVPVARQPRPEILNLIFLLNEKSFLKQEIKLHTKLLQLATLCAPSSLNKLCKIIHIVHTRL